MRVAFVVSALFVAFCPSGCGTDSTTVGDKVPHSDDSKPESESTESHVTISVLKSGMILIDGDQSSISEVEQRLKQLKSEDGTVWYYREAGDQDPPPEATQVITLILDQQLPVTLSATPEVPHRVALPLDSLDCC